MVLTLNPQRGTYFKNWLLLFKANVQKKYIYIYIYIVIIIIIIIVIIIYIYIIYLWMTHSQSHPPHVTLKFLPSGAFFERKQVIPSDENLKRSSFRGRSQSQSLPDRSRYGRRFQHVRSIWVLSRSTDHPFNGLVWGNIYGIFRGPALAQTCSQKNVVFFRLWRH